MTGAKSFSLPPYNPSSVHPMKLRISLPSVVNEGENLPVSFAIPNSCFHAPRVDCGFTGLNSSSTLRRIASGDWQGVANVHSGLAGQAYLNLRLTDPSRPDRCWEGEAGVRVAPRQQGSPIHITGVDSNAERGGLGQANSVNITVNGIATGRAGGGGAEASWLNIEVFLNECEAPVTVPRSPLPASAIPVDPLAPRQTTSDVSQPEIADRIDLKQQPQDRPIMSNGWTKEVRVTVSVAAIIAIGVSVLVFGRPGKGIDSNSDPEKVPAINIYNNNNPTSINNNGSLDNTTNLGSNPSAPRRSEDQLPDPSKTKLPPSAPVLSTNAGASTLPQERIQSGAPPSNPTTKESIEVKGMAATYRSGDYLKLQVRLAKTGYVRLLTCDPAGAIVQLYPCQLDTVKALPAEQWIPLPDPEIVSKRSGFAYECYVSDGKDRETTQVLVQWSPYPFELTGMRGTSVFYEPEKPTNLGEIATRGVRVKLGTPAVEGKALTFDVAKP